MLSTNLDNVFVSHNKAKHKPLRILLPIIQLLGLEIKQEWHQAKLKKSPLTNIELGTLNGQKFDLLRDYKAEKRNMDILTFLNLITADINVLVKTKI